MKVLILFLDYQRHDFTERVKQHNFSNACYEFDQITIDKKGIANAINYGIAQASGYDAIVTMANDILMPHGWLNAMVMATSLIPNTGMCGIHCVEGKGDEMLINGIKIHKSFTAFGNVLIPITSIKRIGYFNTDYDPYGMQDADYAYRLNKSGFINYYLDGLKSEHIGHDVGQQTEYRKMKDVGLSVAGEKWARWTAHYDTTGDYTIDLKDWPDA